MFVWGKKIQSESGTGNKMFTKLGLVFLLLVYLNRSLSVDLCDPTTQNVTSYQSMMTQKCGCVQCIRKCCKEGFYLGKNRTCFKLEKPQKFQLDVYETNLKVKDFGFEIGVLQCRFFALNPNDSSDKFLVKKDGTLHLPVVDLTYQNSDYCVDQRNNLTVFVCLEPKAVLGRELNKYGKKKTSYNNK